MSFKKIADTSFKPNPLTAAKYWSFQKIKTKYWDNYFIIIEKLIQYDN